MSGTNTEDDFVKAFESMSQEAFSDEPAPQPEAQEASASEPEKPVEAASEVVAEEVPAHDGEAVPEESQDSPETAAPSAESAPDSSAAAEQPQQPAAGSQQELLAQLVDMLRQNQQPPQQQSPQPQQPTEEAPPVLTSEEVAFLQKYEEEWPDVAKAEALYRKAFAQQLVSYMINEVATVIRPMAEQVHGVAAQTHLNDLRSQVPDYDEIHSKVVDWIGVQPPYLRSTYERVAQVGNVDEVLDLISRWRASTGVVPQAPRPAAAPVRQRTTELPPAAKQAAAALAPVGSKRSEPVSGPDPNDFDGAFADFAKSA